jgi:hypothetical protein
VEGLASSLLRAVPDSAALREYLNCGGVHLELVLADAKVKSGAAGSIGYWSVRNFQPALDHFLSIGASLYRGPLAIENNQSMCQVLDPWGNSIGLRGPN